jgi:hypothetical protein
MLDSAQEGGLGRGGPGPARPPARCPSRRTGPAPRTGRGRRAGRRRSTSSQTRASRSQSLHSPSPPAPRGHSSGGRPPRARTGADARLEQVEREGGVVRAPRRLDRRAPDRAAVACAADAVSGGSCRSGCGHAGGCPAAACCPRGGRPRPCPYNRILARRCPAPAPAPDRMSRSSRRTAGHAVRPGPARLRSRLLRHRCLTTPEPAISRSCSSRPGGPARPGRRAAGRPGAGPVHA